MSIESMMLSNHLFLWQRLVLPSVFLGIRFSPQQSYSTMCFIQPSLFHNVLFSKLHKQSDSIQPCHTLWANQLFHVWSSCFLTYIRFYQETSKVVWYSHLFKQFSQCIVIHIVRDFSTVNDVDVDVFLELPCFLHDPMNVGSLISGSSVFSKSSLFIWKFSVHVLPKPNLTDFEHNLASVWNKHNCTVVWAFFGITHFEIGMKTGVFQSCGHCWVFQICWQLSSAFKKHYLLGF